MPSRKELTPPETLSTLREWRHPRRHPHACTNAIRISRRPVLLLPEGHAAFAFRQQAHPLFHRVPSEDEQRRIGEAAPVIRGFNSLWENLYQLLRGRRHFHRQQLVAAWPIMVRRNGPSFAATDSFAAAQRKSAWR